MEKATFGAGCFWGVEEAFARLKGVTGTAVGYSGGAFDNPTYKDVCAGHTGHAEVVEVDFDPQIISYDDLLQVFWKIHDPTTVDRQGPDIGEQYRSVIFFHDPVQEQIAKSSKDRMQQSLTQRIATQIAPAQKFYRAEEYHQRYFEKNGLPSCHMPSN